MIIEINAITLLNCLTGKQNEDELLMDFIISDSFKLIGDQNKIVLIIGS